MSSSSPLIVAFFTVHLSVDRTAELSVKSLVAFQRASRPNAIVTVDRSSVGNVKVRNGCQRLETPWWYGMYTAPDMIIPQPSLASSYFVTFAGVTAYVGLTKL
jgi:hypothetical protein